MRIVWGAVLLAMICGWCRAGAQGVISFGPQVLSVAELRAEVEGLRKGAPELPRKKEKRFLKVRRGK